MAEMMEVVRESRRRRNAYVPPKAKPSKKPAGSTAKPVGTRKKKSGGVRKKTDPLSKIDKMSRAQKEALLKMLKGK